MVVLDLNLPGMDGLDVLKKIRNEKPELKVLILSARNSVNDKVTGLDYGANDYLPTLLILRNWKPVSEICCVKNTHRQAVNFLSPTYVLI